MLWAACVIIHASSKREVRMPTQLRLPMQPGGGRRDQRDGGRAPARRPRGVLRRGRAAVHASRRGRGGPAHRRRAADGARPGAAGRAECGAAGQSHDAVPAAPEAEGGRGPGRGRPAARPARAASLLGRQAPAGGALAGRGHVDPAGGPRRRGERRHIRHALRRGDVRRRPAATPAPARPARAGAAGAERARRAGGGGRGRAAPDRARVGAHGALGGGRPAVRGRGGGAVRRAPCWRCRRC